MRVVLGEDLALLRDGLIRLLQAHGFDVVAWADNGPDLKAALIEHRPDVAVVDVRMPPDHTDDGLRAAIGARAVMTRLPVLVLSQFVEPLYARELLSDGEGAVGYLLKDRVLDPAQFVEAVRRVAGGGTAMDPEVIAELLTGRSRERSLEPLSVRERQVLELMAEGRSNRAIATQMFVAEKSVAKHINSIFMKLGLHLSDSDNRRVLAVLTYLGS